MTTKQLVTIRGYLIPDASMIVTRPQWFTLWTQPTILPDSTALKLGINRVKKWRLRLLLGSHEGIVRVRLHSTNGAPCLEAFAPGHESAGEHLDGLAAFLAVDSVVDRVTDRSAGDGLGTTSATGEAKPCVCSWPPPPPGPNHQPWCPSHVEATGEAKPEPTVTPENQLPCQRCGAADHTARWHDGVSESSGTTHGFREHDCIVEINPSNPSAALVERIESITRIRGLDSGATIVTTYWLEALFLSKGFARNRSVDSLEGFVIASEADYKAAAAYAAKFMEEPAGGKPAQTDGGEKSSTRGARRARGKSASSHSSAAATRETQNGSALEQASQSGPSQTATSEPAALSSSSTTAASESRKPKPKKRRIPRDHVS